MLVLSFPLQLWSTFAPLDYLCDAQAGPSCHQTSLVVAIWKFGRRRGLAHGNASPLLTPAQCLASDNFASLLTRH
ncbi:MAG: hypothetical protein QOF74_292 [Caballeronia mineralivorans]|nr:hypothetical protein [Caballeronia mineralivorans]